MAKTRPGFKNLSRGRNDTMSVGNVRIRVLRVIGNGYAKGERSESISVGNTTVEEVAKAIRKALFEPKGD